MQSRQNTQKNIQPVQPSKEYHDLEPVRPTMGYNNAQNVASRQPTNVTDIESDGLME